MVYPNVFYSVLRSAVRFGRPNLESASFQQILVLHQAEVQLLSERLETQFPFAGLAWFPFGAFQASDLFFRGQKTVAFAFSYTPPCNIVDVYHFVLWNCFQTLPINSMSIGWFFRPYGFITKLHILWSYLNRDGLREMFSWVLRLSCACEPVTETMNRTSTYSDNGDDRGIITL